jgi:Mn2+/Fe2+ NRAMP family transporter
VASLKSWRVRLALVLAVVGPGFITANVDNDAGGIATYSVAGAQFGYTLLWTMIPITIALVIIQEMSSRMGAVTGKGLSDLIREEFGLRATFLLMIALFVTNFFNIIGEFAGVASSFELFGVSKYIVVPLAAFVVWGIVVHGTYSTVEKVFLSASAFYVAYIVSGVLSHPDWRAAALSTVTRPESAGFRNYGYLSMIIGLAGTTIAPWMQFYLQASIVEKGVTARQYATSRLDVVIGCLFAAIVAWFIVVACAATLHEHGRHIHDAKDAAVALEPLAGSAATTLFGLGLVGAGLLAAAVVPLSTAYSVAEAFDRRADLNDSFREARLFYVTYGASAAVAAALVLIPGAPLVKILFLTQALNAILLLAILPFLRGLARDPEVMGEHRLGRWDSIATAGVIVLVALSVVLLGVLGVVG